MNDLSSKTAMQGNVSKRLPHRSRVTVPEDDKGDIIRWPLRFTTLVVTMIGSHAHLYYETNEGDAQDGDGVWSGQWRANGTSESAIREVSKSGSRKAITWEAQKIILGDCQQRRHVIDFQMSPWHFSKTLWQEVLASLPSEKA